MNRKDTLYEKEIKRLEKENRDLKQQLQVSEAYYGEYAKLCEDMKQLKHSYADKLKSMNALQGEYERLLRKMEKRQDKGR